MSRKYPGRTKGEQIQLAKSREAYRGQAYVSNTLAAMGRKPMRGTGTSFSDLWEPDRQPVATSVTHEDERIGRLFCTECGDEVLHVEVDGEWYVRNQDNLPHGLTCDG